ncbi:hypothetical protein EES41_00650 [Streptomyces sp. ADI95-16]|nr:hypothetical protein EES41_00650 [Streptomyces sp. ADI95-16]
MAEGRDLSCLGNSAATEALKRYSFLAEQDPKALVADVVDHPLSDPEVGQLGQAPGRERQAVLGRLGLGDLLDLPAFGQCESPGPAAFVLGIERVEAVGRPKRARIVLSGVLVLAGVVVTGCGGELRDAGQGPGAGPRPQTARSGRVTVVYEAQTVKPQDRQAVALIRRSRVLERMADWVNRTLTSQAVLNGLGVAEHGPGS